jgi:hypothetical protein
MVSYFQVNETKLLYEFLIFYTVLHIPTDRILFGVITLIIFGEK